MNHSEVGDNPLQSVLLRARQAQVEVARVPLQERNRVLMEMAAVLRQASPDIDLANQADVQSAKDSGLAETLVKRLYLTNAKIEGLARSLEALVGLADPIGRGQGRTVLANGLALETIRVPLGVIGLIFESRPGVAVEAGGLAVKSGNAIILRGGKEAKRSIQALSDAWRKALERVGLPRDLIQCLDDPDRRLAEALMHLHGLDLLIPRGGRGLIETVVHHATVPVIETGIGNCHLYVDESADLDMALHILADGKLGNPAVCNALETLLVHRQVAPAFLPLAHQRLAKEGVVFHGDLESRQWVSEMLPATDEDYAEEYLGLEIAVKVVADVHEALKHIAQYGSNHSEAIVADSYAVGQTFLDEVDAAAVYWNASTRFTDGFEFGLGAEVGISTQKLHARGPMGLEALTTWKTIAYGSGQTRDL